jgi:hypothetical protein
MSENGKIKEVLLQEKNRENEKMKNGGVLTSCKWTRWTRWN